ncbi:MAG: FixH family protein [Parvibaculaceae bacterium]
MSNPTTASEWRVTGRFVFVLLVAFFGVIIAVNLTMAVFASRTWTGLVVENGYVASQHFNSELEQLRRQDKLGWTQRLEVKDGNLVVEFTRRDGSPVSRLSVTANAMRPVDDREDTALGLIETRPGHYEAREKLGFGRWLIDVTAHGSESDAMRMIHDVIVGELKP